jgi:hypothetical protein
MKVKSRIEITIEIDRVMILKGRGRAEQWCPICSRFVWMISLEEAAALADVSLDTIFNRVNLELIHGKENSGGHLLVCLNSLGMSKPG